MSSSHNVNIKRVAILFAGGPAPAANSVIGAAAFAFLEQGIEVIGIKHGYSSLANTTQANLCKKTSITSVLITPSWSICEPLAASSSGPRERTLAR